MGDASCAILVVLCGCGAVPLCLEISLSFFLKVRGNCRTLRLPGQGKVCTNIRKPQSFVCAIDEQEEGATGFPF